MIADWRLVIGDWRLASLVTSHWRSSIVIEIARSHSHRASARCWLRIDHGKRFKRFRDCRRWQHRAEARWEWDV